MKKNLKILSLLLCFTMVFAMLTACGKKDSENVVVMSVEGYGDITIELYPKYAPETVENFKKLVSEGFYDGTVFHRVVEGFMIQGGGYTAENTDTPKKADTIFGEFSSNGYKNNTLSHTRGVISMARTNMPNSASSQFFIMHEDSDFLDGNYAAFGEVIDGMEVVDKIATCQVTANPAMPGEISVPVKYPVITSVTFKK